MSTISKQSTIDSGTRQAMRSYARLCKPLRARFEPRRWWRAGGGEDLLMVLPGSDVAAALAAAERMRAELAATQVALPGGERINFTVSIGVAVPNSNDPEELLRRSDVALYAAKIGGRDRVVLAE